MPLNGQFQDWSDSGGVVKIPDITCWLNDLVLNEHSYEVLVNELSAYGEFLPITVEGISYWLLHVNKFADINAVDESNSHRVVDESDGIHLESLSFKESEVNKLLVFKTKYNDYKNIYCNESFKLLIEKLGLKGLEFREDLASIF